MPKSGTLSSRTEIHRASQLCKRMEHTLESGRWQCAIKLGESVLRCVPHHLWAECLLGQAYLAQGRVRHAQACFRAILERDPECTAAQIGLSVELAFGSQAGRNSEVDRAYRSHLSFQQPQERRGGLIASLEDRWQHTQNLWRLGRLQEASAEAQRMLQLMPESLRATLLLADIAWQNGEGQEFAECLRRAQGLDASGVVARRILGDEHPLLHTLVFDPFCHVDAHDWQKGTQDSEALQSRDHSADTRPEWQEDSVLPPANPPWLLDSCSPSTGLSSPSSATANRTAHWTGDVSPKGLDARAGTDGELAEIELELEHIAALLGADEVSALLSTRGPQSTALSPETPPGSSRAISIPSILSSRPQILPTRRRGTSPLTTSWELILSNRTELEAKYGEPGASRIHQALTELANVTSDEGIVQATVLYLDDERSLQPYGLGPADPRDPEQIGFTLARIEERLADERGGRLAPTYFLLVGGDDIIPFHTLADPSEDQDEFLMSDHPYACRNGSHLSFERAVGRLPDGASDRPDYLLRLITVATEAHRRQGPQSPHPRNSLWQTLEGWLGRARRDGMMASFGYTASVWRRAAREVFSAIDPATHLRTSPPLNSETMPPLGPIAPRFGYFNLHGLRDSAYWYGHRDPAYTADYPLFPVAMKPDNIPFVSRPEGIVFSEACYGAHVVSKDEASSITLRFLAAQALGVVGSTALAYGGIDIPLVGADLLARAFWERVMAGCPLGEALRQAKQALIQEMLVRQGYLDPEDQKALLSFVLYGDPTLVVEAQRGADTYERSSKTVDERGMLPLQGMATMHSGLGLNVLRSRQRTIPPSVTLCRRPVPKGEIVPPELVDRVRREVASYLPSSIWEDVTVSTQAVCRRDTCDGGCSLGRSDRSTTAVAKAQAAQRGVEWLPQHAELVFTLQERLPAMVERADTASLHHQIAKLTVDSEGHLVKVSVSR